MGKKQTYCIAVANQKGGVSKTTSTSCLGYVLGKLGFKVLLIDCDSQASLTQLSGVYPSDFNVDDEEVYGLQDIYEYALECEDKREEYSWEAIKAAIIEPKYREAVRIKENDEYKVDWEYHEFGYSMIPSDAGLANYEQFLSQRKNGGLIMWKIMQVIKEYGGYDFCILDCAPSLSTVTYGALAAATDGIIIPVNNEPMSLRGTRNIISAIAEIQTLMSGIEKDGKKIVHKGILGLLKTQYAKRFRIQRDFDEVIKDFMPIKAFNTSIPSLTACDKAHAKGWLFAQYDHRAFEVYKELCDEIIKKLEKQKNLKDPVIVESIGAEAERALATAKEVDDDE